MEQYLWILNFNSCWFEFAIEGRAMSRSASFNINQ
jgi:hypothetical protein